MAYAQLPDIMLKTIYDADDEGIAKFRAYAEDYLSEDLAREAARASSDDAPIYLDEDSNFDVGYLERYGERHLFAGHSGVWRQR